MGGELAFHFLNVMLMTVLVTPVVLWRYRRAVLAGMQTRLGEPLAVAPARGARQHRTEGASPAVGASLAWEARLRRRILGVAVGAAFVAGLPLAALWVSL
ncbi:MAG: hypothetical protein JO090_08330, partial [Rhizobacter sp.]|nr:hypothetical protein [Rhizobacter sp.]